MKFKPGDQVILIQYANKFAEAYAYTVSDTFPGDRILIYKDFKSGYAMGKLVELFVSPRQLAPMECDGYEYLSDTVTYIEKGDEYFLDRKWNIADRRIPNLAEIVVRRRIP